MSKRSELTRRQFLQTAATTTTIGLLGACAGAPAAEQRTAEEHTSDLRLPFAYDPAQHPIALANATDITLHRLGGAVLRNEEQIKALAASGVVVRDHMSGTDPFREQGHWYETDQEEWTFEAINGERIFQDKLFLFNMIIGLEWQPSGHTLQEMRLAARKISDFLYDVTDGYMAIGQVIIGGPELLDAADIQVLASNRLHPRAWNDALHKPKKYQPIRVGRGLWQKNRDLLFPWSSPEGYRTLVHEWGHYAFGLVDRYLEKRLYGRADATQALWDDTKPTSSPIAVAVPRIALPVETIMANQEISEYAEADEAFKHISERFNQTITRNTSLSGPEELPLTLPSYPTLDPPLDRRPEQDVQLMLHAFIAEHRLVPQATPQLNPTDTSIINGSYWLYVLKYDGANPAEATPTRIIAQGKVNDRDREHGFRLLGADYGDQVVIVSEYTGHVKVHGGTLQVDGVKQWVDLTPGDGQTSVFDAPFFVDVIPQTLGDIDPTDAPRIVNVAVNITAIRQPDDVLVYRYGRGPSVDMDWPAPEQTGPQAATVTSAFKTVVHLDGHIFLRWRSADGGNPKLFICSYSQGGGPASIGGKPSISGGSAEGNAMLFFLGPDVWGADPERDKSPSDYSKVRIVTTVLPAHTPLSVAGTRETSDDVESRSYVFSLAANESLVGYAATLVLYYDNGAPKYGGDLYIYRWDSDASTWRRLTTIVPSDLAYIAVPFTKDTQEAAPSFMDGGASPRIERYRILWERFAESREA